MFGIRPDKVADLTQKLERTQREIDAVQETKKAMFRRALEAADIADERGREIEALKAEVQNQQATIDSLRKQNCEMADYRAEELANLRDDFAKIALKEILTELRKSGKEPPNMAAAVARCAWAYADAMMVERDGTARGATVPSAAPAEPWSRMPESQNALDVIGRLRAQNDVLKLDLDRRDDEAEQLKTRIDTLEKDLAEARQREEDAVSQHDTLREQRDAEKALAERLRKQADYDRRQSDHKSTVIDRLNSEIDACRKARGL